MSVRGIAGVVVGIALALAAGPAGAGFEEGKAAARRGDYVGAYREWKPLAEGGHAEAQFLVGLMYREGRGVPQDWKAAAGWFEQAAGQGHADASFFLGRAFREGRGVEQDFAEALKWFKAAADRDHPDAAFTVGLMHRMGQGIAKDDRQAVAWYRKAAALGHGEARFTMGAVSEEGRGVRRDLKQAYAWYSLAEESGVEIGGILRDGLAKQLTLSEIDEAKALAEQWRTDLEAGKVPPEMTTADRDAATVAAATPRPDSATPSKQRQKDKPVAPAASGAALARAADGRGAQTPAQNEAENREAFRVRLAAYRAAEGPDRGWATLLKANRDLLGRLKPHQYSVDLGPERGIYYRLEAGPIEDREAARALCDALKARELECLVVKP